MAARASAISAVIVMQVVDRQQARPERLAALEEVMQVRAAEVRAGRAAAGRVERHVGDARSAPRVMRTRPVEVNAVPCQARWVGRTQSNMSTPRQHRLQQIGRRADAHQVARPIRGQQLGGEVRSSSSRCGARVADREAADREAVERMLR